MQKLKGLIKEGLGSIVHPKYDSEKIASILARNKNINAFIVYDADGHMYTLDNDTENLTGNSVFVYDEDGGQHEMPIDTIHTIAAPESGKTVRETMHEAVDYHASLSHELHKAKKERNAEKIVFYTDAHSKAATASFDRFKGSAAYEPWKKKNAQKIQQVQKELDRFAYMHEAKNPPTPKATPSLPKGPIAGGKRATINDPIDEPTTGWVYRRKENTGTQHHITPYDEMWEQGNIKMKKFATVNFNRDTDTWYDALSDFVTGNQGMNTTESRLIFRLNKLSKLSPSENTILQISKLLDATFKVVKEKSILNLAKQAKGILNNAYVSEFKNQYGPHSQASEFLSVLNQSLSYGDTSSQKSIAESSVVAPKGPVAGGKRKTINDPIDEPATMYVGRRKENTGKQHVITPYDDQWENKIKEVKTNLSVPEKHQLKIAYDTLKMPDPIVAVMGGPTKEEAIKIIKQLTGRTVKKESMKLKDMVKVDEFVGQKFNVRDRVIVQSPYSTKNETFEATIDRKLGADQYRVKPVPESLSKLDRAQQQHLKKGLNVFAAQMKKKGQYTAGLK